MDESETERKSGWWIPYWLSQIILAIVFWVGGYCFLNFSLVVTSIGLIFTFVLVSILYHVRSKQPNWIKPYWIILTISVIIFGVVSTLFLNIPLERALMSTVLILLAVGLGYRMRTKPNLTFNRAMYIGIGAVVLGFMLWGGLTVILNATGIRWLIDQTIPDGILAITTLILCYITGAFIGDLIGKRRDYWLPLFPPA